MAVDGGGGAKDGWMAAEASWPLGPRPVGAIDSPGPVRLAEDCVFLALDGSAIYVHDRRSSINRCNRESCA